MRLGLARRQNRFGSRATADAVLRPFGFVLEPAGATTVWRKPEEDD
jgi:hypothetical protein